MSTITAPTPTAPATGARVAEPVPAALREALVAGERPEPPGPVAACRVFARRGLLKIRHVPEQLLDVTITPALFLLMFTYLFGGAVAGSTGDYLQYILPGILVQSVLFTAVYSGVVLNTDKARGVVDRFRTMPVWRAAPLVGAVFGDAMRSLVAAVILLALGFALGFSAAGGVVGVVLAVALVAAFAFSLSWVFTTAGLLMRSQSAVMNAGFMALFPLVFLSNIMISPETLPAVLEWFVGVNPVSHLTTAARSLMGGDADLGAIGLVLAEGAALTAVFATITARLYHR